MKKTTLALFLTGMSFSALAQNWLITGNSVSSTDFIGGTSATTNPLVFKTAGNERMRIHGTTGAVGIGTVNPTERLHIGSGNILVKGINNFGASGHTANVFLGDNYNYIKAVHGVGVQIGTYGGSGSIDGLTVHSPDGYVGINTSTPGGRFAIKSNQGEQGFLLTNHCNQCATNANVFEVRNYVGINAENKTLFRINSSGQILVGTAINPSDYNYKLAVDGKIIAEELKIQMSENWADYVFSKDYKLKSLEEVELYIGENGHLPSIPSSEDVKSAGGFNIGEIEVKLLEKIEELTLYVISQEKKINELQKQIKECKND